MGQSKAPVEILHSPPVLFFLIQSICGPGGTLFATRIPPFLYLPRLSPPSILSFIQTVNLLSCGRRGAVFPSPSHSSALLEKVCCERS